MSMVDYELEYINWKERQLALRKKYADTPPGLSGEQAKAEEERQTNARKAYEEQRCFRLISGVTVSEEPFVGRQQELKAVRRLLEAGEGAVFLSGMGGIGKSALAQAYVRVYGDEYDHILLWRYDRNLEQILADDGQLGISNLSYDQNRYPSRRRYAAEKYEKLLQIGESKRLLVILDNFNSLEDPWLKRLLEIPCDLLVTTRLGGFVLKERGHAVLEVKALADEGEWKAFYRLYTGKEAKGETWEAAKNYRESVLGHTLKMKLALSNPGQEWSSKGLARSILSNFRLKRTEIQILCELSYGTLTGILEEAYLSCTEEKQESLDNLKKYSLVQQQTDSMGRTFVSLHPVIAQAVQHIWHPGLARCEKFLQKFAVYIRFTWYRPRDGELWLVPQVFSLLKRLPEPVAWRYYLYECLATFLFVWEYFREAEEIVVPLYECVRSYFGEIHQFSAYMALRVAEVYYDSLQFEKSRSWYELSFRLYGMARPVDHDFYHNKATVGSRMARILEYAGEYEEAHRCLDTAMEAMEDFQRDTQEADPKRWRLRRIQWQYAYMRRAALYFRQGDLERAERELDTGLHLFPLNEFQLVEVGRLRARLYLARGEYGKAREAAAADLKVCVRYQGETVKMSLACREVLGDALALGGQVQEAQEEYTRVLNGLQRKYPYQDEWIARLLTKLEGLA